MNDLAHSEPRDDEFARMTDAELDAYLARWLGFTAPGVVKISRAIAEKKRRGHEVSGLCLGLGEYLLRVGCGQLLPEAIVKYASNKNLLRCLSRLSLIDQKRLLESGAVPVLVYAPDNSLSLTNIPLEAVTSKQLTQVFAHDGHIRDESAQAAILHERRTEAARQDPERIGILLVDPERGVAEATKRGTITRDQLEAALSVLRRGRR